jgi:hypothetical protein
MKGELRREEKSNGKTNAIFFSRFALARCSNFQLQHRIAMLDVFIE